MYEAEHIKKVEDLLKKAPFWKYATVATVCIEQEYKVYEVLAKDCFFDMTKFLGKVVKRFWQSVPTGYSIGDSYLLAIEESFFEPRDEWEEIALQIVKDMEHTFYGFWEKSATDTFANLKRQLEIGRRCAQLAGMSTEETDMVISKICTNQKTFVEEIVAVPNKEKKAFLTEFQNKKREQIIDLALVERLCPVHKEKPAKKKLPEIRNTSVDFDMEERKITERWLLDSTPEQWVKKLWESHDYKAAFSIDYTEMELPRFCDIMSWAFGSYAERDYIENRMPERTRAFWYLEAYNRLCIYELVEKGYPLPENHVIYHHMEWFADSRVGFAMICAYAAGAEDLIPRLYHFTKGVHKNHPYTQAQDYMELFAGENNEALYHRVEQWEKSDIREMILWILKGDAKEFRKALLHSVRHARKEYDMGRSFIGPWDYACVKIAKKYGIEVEPVKVVELLDWNFDETPIDRQKWRPFLQDKIDEWLENH